MNAKTAFLISALMLAAGSASADESSRPAPLTRAQVKQSVLAAQAARQLIPAGEGEIRVGLTSRSTLTRQEVAREVVGAERAGELVPAGEGEFRDPLTTGGVTLSRAQVKAATLRAVAAGEIIPAGEASDEQEARHASASSASASGARG